MDLLFSCENYPPSVGGVQEVMRQLAERLVARGHSVTVATGHHPKRERSTRLNGVRVESFRVSGNAVRGMHGDVDRYRRFVTDGRFDAILVKAAQQWTFDALTPVLGTIRSRKVFIPCGFSGLHDPAYRDYFVSMTSWLLSFDALIFYSSRYRDIAFARAAGASHIHVVPNGADEREFASVDDGGFRAEWGIRADENLLLSVGTLIPAKGHWEVATAFDLAHLDAPATLIINGNSPHVTAPSRLRSIVGSVMAHRLPLKWHVQRINARHRGRRRIILANLPRVDLVRAYKAADLFVFASHVEYSPLVLFESVAAGTPFLSPPVGNAEEIATWTSAGIIYPAEETARGDARIDSHVLARHLEASLTSPDNLAAIGAQGRRSLLAAGLTWDAIVPRYEAILAR